MTFESVCTFKCVNIHSLSEEVPTWLSFHCRVSVETLSGLRCSGVVTWMQASTSKPTSPGCLYTLTMKASMWRYRPLVALSINIWPELSQVDHISLHHVPLHQSLFSRSRRKMKVLSWLSTASWTPCASQSSPFSVAGSATFMLMPMSFRTLESWTGLTELSSLCSTLVKSLSSQIFHLFLSYQTRWRCWWAQTVPTMARCSKSLRLWQRWARVWWYSTPPALGIIPTTPTSATFLRRPAIWRSWTYSINANKNRHWHSFYYHSNFCLLGKGFMS